MGCLHVTYSNSPMVLLQAQISGVQCIVQWGWMVVSKHPNTPGTSPLWLAFISSAPHLGEKCVRSLTNERNSGNSDVGIVSTHLRKPYFGTSARFWMPHLHPASQPLGVSLGVLGWPLLALGNSIPSHLSRRSTTRSAWVLAAMCSGHSPAISMASTSAPHLKSERTTSQQLVYLRTAVIKKQTQEISQMHVQPHQLGRNGGTRETLTQWVLDTVTKNQHQ